MLKIRYSFYIPLDLLVSPKGVMHTTGGYMVYASMTHEYIFNYKEGDVYWCTADVGWVTGHSYIVYGPLANGATTLVFEECQAILMQEDFGKCVTSIKLIFFTQLQLHCVL